VLGLAIYNGVLLDFPLPLALYRKILGQEVKLRDLEDMQPTLGRWVMGADRWAGVWQALGVQGHGQGSWAAAPMHCWILQAQPQKMY